MRVYHLKTLSDRSVYMKDKRVLIVAQRTCDEEVLNYASNLEAVRMKGEGISQ